ncbi:MAG: bacteriohemerythrin [Acidobacteria bacterium]|nr:bacteriohemerythrin [Acidobacteriota bacterium]NIM61580.1 bacteriohemerythrin [Acidobacteriota bacterium]NIO58144.1 bacteriohemerythrin [Acidobacteriota bacterium]NIQ29160.1 bacteriohemerythrin [Acidobacteriota bacterium]NIQ85072.1 bacteriohemerythrin [Acidobacteriota bacterium]
MPLITWGPQLETGIPTIDAQHKRLVDIINNLNDALNAGRRDEEMGAIFDELVAYTETHFTYEEKLLTSHEYDELEEHCREHRVFTDQIKMDRDNFNAGVWEFEQRFLDYLRGWLINHIQGTDRAYVPTLKEAGVE